MYLVSALYYGVPEAQVVGITPTAKLADALVARVKELHDLKDSDITIDKFREMEESISWKDDISALFNNYPEYSVSDIERAVKYYSTCQFIGCVIMEGVDIFTCNDDILNYGTDRR